MKKNRQANLELLRIISMLMIVTIHTINHGDLITFAKQGTASYYPIWTLFGIGFGSITIYLLISSYFLIDAKFSTWKIAKLAGQVLFYSLGITLIFLICGWAEPELKYVVFSVLPILSDFYWFVSMYVGMYLLAPIMNKLIRALTKRQLECAIALCLLLVSVWPNIIYYSSALNTAGGVSISWFLTVYLIGAYLKLYYKPDGKFGKKLLMASGVTLLIPLSRFVIEALLKTPLGKISILEDLMWGYSVFFNYSSILASASAILLFIAFLNLEIKPGKGAAFINTIAGAVFGVYLIHDHYYIRESLWDKVCAYNWLEKWYLVPCIVLTVFAIFGVCAVIELLRQKLFAPLERSQRLKGFFFGIDEKLRRMWRG